MNLAVREHGNYTLRVRFADGTVKEQKIAVGGTAHMKVVIVNGVVPIP